MASVLTRTGREIIADRIHGTGTEPVDGAWGLNPNTLTAANTDIALFKESTEARVAGTASIVTGTTTNDTWQNVYTITAGGSETIAEWGLFTSTTQPTTNTVAAGGVVASSSSTTLNTGTTFSPGNNNYVQIRTEVMQVTAGSGTTALTVVRGQNGSTAISTIAASDVITPGNPPGQTGITGGTMFAKGDFTGIALSSSDSIQFTIKVTFS